MENEMPSTESVIIIFFVFILVCSLFFFTSKGFEILDNIHYQKVCNSNGFSELSNQEAKSGYIVCCKDVYQDNIKIDEVCKAFKAGDEQ